MNMPEGNRYDNPTDAHAIEHGLCRQIGRGHSPESYLRCADRQESWHYAGP